MLQEANLQQTLHYNVRPLKNLNAAKMILPAANHIRDNTNLSGQKKDILEKKLNVVRQQKSTTAPVRTQHK